MNTNTTSNVSKVSALTALVRDYRALEAREQVAGGLAHALNQAQAACASEVARKAGITCSAKRSIERFSSTSLWSPKAACTTQ